MTELLMRDQDGQYRSATPEETLAAARQIRESSWLPDRDQIKFTPQGMDYLSMQLADRDVEVLATLFLDINHNVIAYEELALGTVRGVSICIREVVESALNHNAITVIFAHNHPNGSAISTNAETSLSNRLAEALDTVGCQVLDHYIVGRQPTFSFLENGLINVD